jgi:hypothetical protein
MLILLQQSRLQIFLSAPQSGSDQEFKDYVIRELSGHEIFKEVKFNSSYKKITVFWDCLVATLLKLKVIKNDDMNGLMTEDEIGKVVIFSDC